MSRKKNRGNTTGQKTADGVVSEKTNRRKDIPAEEVKREAAASDRTERVEGDADRTKRVEGDADTAQAYELTFLHFDKEGVMHRRSIGKSTLLWALSIPVLFMILIVLLYEQRLSAIEEKNKEAALLADTLRNNIITQATEAEALNRQIEELKRSNDELTLSLAEKDGEINARQDEDAETKIPGAYPILGSAQLILPENTEAPGAGGGDAGDGDEAGEEEREEPAVFFKMGEGCRVVASGSGMITEITTEEDGNVTIEIDHGNGYHSFYTGRGVTVLNRGEYAAAGSVLLIPAEEGTTVTYRVSRDGRYIDPMEFMEVNG